jgi:cytochrome oxidase Cu insertion factor (SCO1/SenC/PrrC family)
MSGTWLAALGFATVLATGTAWFRRVFAVAIPQDRTPFVALMAVGAVLGVAALVRGTGWVGGAGAVFAVVGGGLFLFTFLISTQKGGSGRLLLGEPIPDFTAPDHNGDPFALSSLAGSPFLLKFFRGHW